MIKAGIVGATGYTGLELLRILSRHTEVEITTVTSRSEAGKPVSAVFPALRGGVDLEYTTPDTGVLKSCDVVFFATPNGTAMHQVPELLDADVRIIDLSADFRLRDPAVWEQWYNTAHACPELLGVAVYGLTEINRDRISEARLIANPGCYPTAVQLGFIPLLEKKLVNKLSLVADAKSGVSGAGRNASPGTQFCESADSFHAYAADGHRHLPEINQGLQHAAGGDVELVFVPHLLPVNRGIQATLYAVLEGRDYDLQTLYEQRYAGEPFIDVMPPGSHPDTASVRGSNLCRIAVTLSPSGNTVVVQVVEDNLVKGAAGQAVQNMNLMFCLPETTALLGLPLVP